MDEIDSALPITNDFMFTRVMRDPEICKEFLQEVLPDIRIRALHYLEPQKTLEGNVDARGVRLDVYVEDGGKVYDIEMQTVPQSDLGRRARYYQGHVDMDLLKKGEKYDKLKDSYIIFICTFDPFGFEHYVYTFENQCEEVGDLKLSDGTWKLFLNTKGKEGPERPNLKMVLDYFDNKPLAEPTELVKRMENAVEIANKDKGWRREIMNLEMKMYDRERFGEKRGEKIGEKRGEKRGAEKKAREVALNLLKQNLPIPLIADATGLSEAEILKLKQEL